jgi:hypothetical protein
MNTNFETIAKAFRHNTGASFLDSGSAYGRHHEKPPIAEKSPLVTIDIWRNEVNGCIETAHFLSETCEVDVDLQKQFEEWAGLEENSDLSWFEAGEKFATEVLGLTQEARDNTYNGENDLSQNYVWEVYTDGESSDWIYADNALMLCYAHTGCDVRGGYAYPLFLRSCGEYAIPMDLSVEHYICEARLNGEVLEDNDCRDLDQQWQCGYSSNPSYQLSNDIERVFGFTKTNDTVVIKLKSGEIAKIQTTARTYY